MKRIAILLFLVGAFSCTQKPKVAGDVDVTGIRPPLAVEYVGIPKMKVYASPSETAEVIGQYAFAESISVLSRQGEWSEIRSFDTIGWIRSNELMDAAKAKEIEANPVPRFYVEPVKVENPRARGEIVMQAKVNTEGDVYQVTTMSNTTGILSLGDDNATALAQAKFYPLIDKNGRKAFVYEYRVAY